VLPALQSLASAPFPSNVRATRLSLDGRSWHRAAAAIREGGGALLALWGTDDRDRDRRFRVHAAYLLPSELLLVEHALPEGELAFPDLASLFPCAARLQRAVADLLGIRAYGGDARGWVRHGGWPEQVYPLRRDVDPEVRYPAAPAPYRYLSVAGDGVHEIAVGPVHAGTIEPGGFRFSVVGEKVLRLEQRLAYTHKGVDKRFERFSQSEGHRLAARVSGDSCVAYAWAYCAALEAMTGTMSPARATALRALALERERLANHLGDLGALGNDAGFAFGLAQFSRLKEELLRSNDDAFGARYPFDLVVPGGVAVDLPATVGPLLVEQLDALEQAVHGLRGIYDEHAGLQDRFRGAGWLDPGLARTLGAIGLVGRASGVGRDLRVDQPWAPYDRLGPRLMVREEGDVAARVQLRFDETLESIRLCRAILEDLPAGGVRAEVPVAAPGSRALGVIEGWRGPVLVALEAGSEGKLRRGHAHDPSWQNWPVLEFAILGNIVPDFPLINKSFNLSYSGPDG